jgi:3'5'-cyclic nucleotide phosphodiesterase
MLHLFSIKSNSTGIKEKIQISSVTASILIAAGKSHWVTPREDEVNAKGKGILHTFWLRIESDSTRKVTTSSIQSDRTLQEETIVFVPAIDKASARLKVPKKDEKLVDWICELLQSYIKKIVATRDVSKGVHRCSIPPVVPPLIPNGIPMEEVVEAIILPEFKIAQSPYHHRGSNLIELNPTVSLQVYELSCAIVSKYNDNPFHNFEHACHVTMSVSKLLARVVTPDLDLETITGEHENVASHLHDYTYGITSDPITQLAIIFSAIIHDMDHQGISNSQLIQEDAKMATMYCNQSVAEQNSLDIAWTMLMSEHYHELRNCIFGTSDELKRFRQIVVNAVLATDIMDKELNDLRKNRWDKVFSSGTSSPEHKNFQTAIVIEHLMQASDVSHTMQHWHVYRKWNANLFREIYQAHLCGRVKANPVDFWYKGELDFFDYYIIPLAKKLKDCNVFGVSSDEYLNYAEKNRAEWEARGHEIVTEMMDETLLASLSSEVEYDAEDPNMCVL